MHKLRWQIAQYFERRWWQAYLAKKDRSSYLQWKKDYWINFLKKIQLSQRDFAESVVDIGCGPAGIFMLFEQNSVLALDPLYEEYVAKNLMDPGAYPWVNFVGQSFESFSTEEEYADIFCLNAINHFIDLEASAKKLYTMTKEGGRLILSIDAHRHSLFKRLFRLLPLDILH
ncbi:MAG: methyltransferase domain-containing protein, partial [Chitinophagales bacterium]